MMLICMRDWRNWKTHWPQEPAGRKAYVSSRLTSRTMMNHQESAMKRLLVPASRPRNPLVPAAHSRKAGKHAKSRGAQRQAARRTLALEMKNASFWLALGSANLSDALQKSLEACACVPRGSIPRGRETGKSPS